MIFQFVYGYLIVMEGEEVAIKEKMAPHLKELMLDTQLYGWEHTRTFHGVWLNQLEQGMCTWSDEKNCTSTEL